MSVFLFFSSTTISIFPFLLIPCLLESCFATYLPAEGADKVPYHCLFHIFTLLLVFRFVIMLCIYLRSATASTS